MKKLSPAEAVMSHVRAMPHAAVEFTLHARERMAERHVPEWVVRLALVSGTPLNLEDSRRGAGYELTVRHTDVTTFFDVGIAVYRDRVVVLTVGKRRPLGGK